MGKLRQGSADGLEDEHVLKSVGEVILPAHDVRNVQVDIVGTGRHMIGRHSVAAQQREVLDISSVFRLLSINQIGERNCAPALA